MALSAEFLKRYEFDWETLDVLIGGQSAIDTGKGLNLRSPEEAIQFMDCYGYNIENPIEKAELFGNFQEALNFIRRFFLQPQNPDGLKLEIPRKIAELTDITQLILYAGSLNTNSNQNQNINPTQTLLGLWACSILKIMHTIAHIDKDLRSPYFTDVQTQILDRFYKVIFRDDSGQIHLGRDSKDEDKIDLISFESKPKKARDSVILKLLHKSENVAEDIFDRVGIRFVTKNRFDAIRVVKFLKDKYVIMPANIKPSRSKNMLIGINPFKKELDRLLKDVESLRIAPGELYRNLVAFCNRDDIPIISNEETTESNPHTSTHYRSLQFTCRRLVKIKNPLFDEIKTLKQELKNEQNIPESIYKRIDQMDLRNIQKEIRFFYPFEIQIFDEKSYIESTAGKSSHSNYKKSQIQTALKRVMGELVRFT